MKKQSLNDYKLYRLIITFLFCFLFPIFGVKAQLIPDNTLGNENSVVTSINEYRDEIEGGALRGSNLFHSFTEFNVGNFQEVYFRNPTDVTNILTRVTGSNVSNILGTLGVLGNANLFLINPHGIYFGENAKLDINGSFTASTADGIMLGENDFFSATDPQNSTLLNIQPGVLFTNALRDYQSNITNDGTLTVGQDLILEGDRLIITGKLGAGNNLILQGNDSVTIRDNVENPFIAAARNNLTITGNNLIDIFALNHEDSGLYSGNNLTLISDNTVIGDAHFNSGGNFKIEDLQGNLGNLSSPNDPIIRSYGDVSFGFYKGTSLHIIAGGSVDIGTAWIWYPEIGEAGGENIDFIKEDVTLSDGKTIINIDGSSRPTLDIRAGVLPEYIGNIEDSNITGFLDWYPYEYFADQTWSYFEDPTITETPTSANIKIGDIYIDAPDGQVFLTNQYHPNNLEGNINITPQIGRWGYGIDTGTEYSGFYGDGGDIIFDSRGNINISGVIDTLSYKNGGDLILNAQGNINININNSNLIRTFGIEKGGNIILNSNENINIGENIVIHGISNNHSGDVIFNSNGNINLADNILINTYSNQLGGNVNFDSQGSINLGQNILIDTRTYQNLSNSGNVNFNSDGDINLGQGISINASSNQNGGNILFDSEGNIHLNPNIFFNTYGAEQGGNISFYSKGELNLDQGIYINTASNQNAGNILFDSEGNIHLNPNIFLNASGAEQGGNISFYSKLNTNLGSNISINSISDLNSGNILFDSDLNLNLGQGILINTNSQQNAGNIILNSEGNINLAPEITITNSAVKQGGNIIFDANGNISIDHDNEILAIATERGGNINLSANNINLNLVDISALGLIGGTIDLNANQEILLNGTNIINTNIGNSNNINSTNLQGGNINFNSQRLIINNSLIATNTYNQNNAGNINFNATEKVIFDHSFTESISGKTAIGNAGNINVITGVLELWNDSYISASTLGQGNAGNINLNATEKVIFNDSFADNSVGITAEGNAGDLVINTTTLELWNLSQISTNTYGLGNAGTVNLNATEKIIFDHSFASSLVGETGEGNAGGIEINTNKLNLLNGSQISASTFGIGDAGGVEINTNTLEAFNNSIISASTFGLGDAGTVNLNATEKVIFNNSSVRSSVSATSSGVIGEGNAGGVVINTTTLELLNNSLIDANTFGRGNAGNINLNATEKIIFDHSFTNSSVGPTGEGNAGGVVVNTMTLELNGSSIDADTYGLGNAGIVDINATEKIFFDDSFVSSAVGETGQGNAGGVKITTSVLELGNGSGILASTFGLGSAGNIEVIANNLQANNGSNISSATSNIGNAGNIKLTIADNIILDGQNTGIFANTQPGSTGNGGTINIDPINTIIRNGAGIGVNSQGTGRGGDIYLTSDNLTLENNAFISAETLSTDGGNINLQIGNILWLRGGSNITATAGTALSGGNGGNININAPWIIALPNQNNNITANAFTGNGGNINITTNALFGIGFTGKNIPVRNDITVSSQFGLDGSFILNTPAVDPTSGLINLPQNLVTMTVVNQCEAGETNSFVIMGKGGLPSIPSDDFIEENLWEDWQEIKSNTVTNQTINNHNYSNNSNPENQEIIQAQGWGITTEGEVMLTQNPVNVSPQVIYFTTINCH
jgi:filamentous hemagglutinin family protein